MMPFGVGAFPVIFIIIFVLIAGTIVFRAVRGVMQWQSNNQQPVLTVSALVVSKRMQVHRHTSNNNGQVMSSNSTSYYVTFEVQSGDRMELKVHGRDYGLIAERDRGDLTFQGTRFHQFDRR